MTCVYLALAYLGSDLNTQMQNIVLSWKHLKRPGVSTNEY
jgi:hypothetical protein